MTRTLAEAEEWERARQVATTVETAARSITDPHEQAEALRGLDQALAQAGELERAETIARSITDPYARAQALASIIEKSDPKNSRRILATFLIDTQPTALLEVIARVDPEAVINTAQYVKGP